MTTPSPASISFYITNYGLYAPKDVQKEITNTGTGEDLRHRSKEVNKNKFAIDLETECPRCHDIMTLCSNFDQLCYTAPALNHSM
jgi:hypothetical protein